MNSQTRFSWFSTPLQLALVLSKSSEPAKGGIGKKSGVRFPRAQPSFQRGNRESSHRGSPPRARACSSSRCAASCCRIKTMEQAMVEVLSRCWVSRLNRSGWCSRRYSSTATGKAQVRRPDRPSRSVGLGSVIAHQLDDVAPCAELAVGAAVAQLCPACTRRCPLVFAIRQSATASRRSTTLQGRAAVGNRGKRGVLQCGWQSRANRRQGCAVRGNTRSPTSSTSRGGQLFEGGLQRSRS